MLVGANRRLTRILRNLRNERSIGGFLKVSTYSQDSVKYKVLCRAVYSPGKTWEGPHLSSLADIEDLHKQKLRAKSEL